ncbi:DnaA regulatory inactivator Hda [Nitrosomonas sp.]|uniref:DnaA regulatory inactivator Hda n=1 Tax=Nitrosomonas sp. TaxID=42353 RepID=UPI0035AE865D
MQQLLLDIKPVPSPVLANFVPGRNAELLQTLQNWPAEQAAERFIYVWGAPGCGKSHLLQATVAAYIQKKLKAVYCCAGKPGNFQDMDENTADCLAIDDIENLDAPAQIALFNLYNRLRDSGRTRLLMSGSAAPMYLQLRQDLVTRIGWGLVYQVHELTDEEKTQAMQTHAADCGFELSHDICRYLLRHGRRDLPSLLMTLEALDRYSLIHQRPITIPLLRELLQVTT